MNKKGMELQLSFLISVILGIVLLSLGLVFTYNLVKSTAKITENGLPSYFEVEAENCVQRGDRVCIPVIKKETHTTKTASFGVVINNIYGVTKDFKLFVNFRRGLTEDDEMINSIDMSDWSYTDFRVIELENNEHEIIEIPIRPPRKMDAGNYVFNVEVCFDGPDNPSEKCSGSYPSLYSPTQQITVVVI